ncbi:MAG: putative transcriptional regulator [Salibacteraceae bacterium]|jgi:putative transcriptional regulator
MQNTVKLERTRMNLTQQDLADRIGVSRQTIHSIEKGKYAPSTELALRMSAVFGISVNQFFTLKND